MQSFFSLFFLTHFEFDDYGLNYNLTFCFCLDHQHITFQVPATNPWEILSSFHVKQASSCGGERLRI